MNDLEGLLLFTGTMTCTTLVLYGAFSKYMDKKEVSFKYDTVWEFTRDLKNYLKRD